MTVIELETLSRAFALIFLGIVFRSSILAAISALLILFFRSQSPEIKHFIWRGVLYGMLLLPILELAVPPVHHTSQVLTAAAVAIVPAPLLSDTNQGKALPAPPTIDLNRTQPTFPWIVIAPVAYLLLAFALLLRLGISLLRLKRIIRRSEPVSGCDLPELGPAISLQSSSGLPPRIRISSEVCVPVAVGIRQISILLPASWRLWRRDKLQAVLVHEMAHVRRKDPTTALLASLAVCLLWFHPLAYWLRRQLATLSEEACDQAALHHVSPARYSQILIEFASDMAKSGNRLIAAAGVSARRSSLRKRLERIWSVSPYPGTNYRPIRLLLLTAFLPVLYLTAAARFDRASAANGSLTVDSISIGSQQQAEQLESSLRKDPGNLARRGSLMSFYANQGNEIDFTRHLLWVIDHHPEASIAGMRVYASARPGQAAANSDQVIVKAAWERSLSRHASSPEVLYHAGLYFERQDSQRALALFHRAIALAEPQSSLQSQCLDAVAVVYGVAVITDLKHGDRRFQVNDSALPTNTASLLRSQINSSTDPQLLSNVGTILTQLGDNQIVQAGLLLLQKAVDLDPGNPKWSEALESAKAEPIRRRNRAALASMVK